MYIIKEIPEDFVVEEQPNRTWEQEGSFSVLKMTKKGRNTEDVIQQLVKQLHLPRNAVAYSGTKDKQAITTQYISLKGKISLKNVSVDNVTFELVGYTHEPLSLGSLERNSFTVVVRNIDSLPKKITTIKNYYGEQRFSSHNATIGKLILQRKFKEACNLIDQSEVQEFLIVQPKNFVGALRSLPKKTLSIYVHAYQSLLFNTVLASLDNPPKTLPLVGFDTDENIYDMFLEKDDLTKRSFIIREIPDLTCEGSERETIITLSDLVINSLEEDELYPDKKKTTLTFSLPKGSYATVVIKELFS